jgi:hypothetical protein
MAGYSAYQGSPVTQQAVVSVNAGFDRMYCNFRKEQDQSQVPRDLVSNDDHCFSIQQRELVFRLKNKYDKSLLKRPATNGINDMMLKVFSSANMFPDARRFRPLNRMPATHLSDRAVLRDTVCFVGVAATPIDYMNKNQKDNLAVQVSGSCSIWNTGGYNIRPGQKIIWDMPSGPSGNLKRKTIMGEPLNKQLFAVMPLECAYTDGGHQTAYDFVSGLIETHPHLDKDKVGKTEEAKMLSAKLEELAAVPTGGSRVKPMKEYLQLVISMYEEMRSRVIGVALSGARPGESFDIMLCSFH